MPPVAQAPISLGSLDIFIILFSLTVVLAVGFRYARIAKRGSDSYFLGERGLPGWANGISSAATAMNSDVAPGYCGMMAATGVYLAWWYFSRFGLALMLAGILFASFWRRLRLFTVPEFYSLRFGSGIGSAVRTWVAFRNVFVASVVWTGTGLLGIHKIVGQLVGWKLTTTILLVVPFVFFYVYIAGYRGVVATDIIQTVIMIGANMVLAVVVLVQMGGPQNLGMRLASQFGPEVLSILPPAADEQLGIVAILAWMIGASIGFGGDPGSIEGQRILACKSEKDAAWMYFSYEITLFLLLVILTLPALGGILLWPEFHTHAYTPGHDPELIYGRMLSQFLGPGLLGLALASLIASVMSTISGHLNAGGQVVTNDIYRQFINKNPSDRQVIRVGRLVMLIIVSLAVIVALKAKTIVSVAIFMLGLSSAELAANWAQWWWWRFNKYGRLAATFGGPFIFLLSQFFWTKIIPIKSLFTRGYLSTLSGIAGTTVVWVVVTLATKPDDEELLKKFYMKARPLGYWKPIRKKCEKEPGFVPDSRKRPVLKGLFLALIGFLSIAGLISGISYLYVGKMAEGSGMILGFFGFGYFFLRLFNRFFAEIQG